MKNNSKTRDVVIGFFGWLLVNNLLALLLFNFYNDFTFLIMWFLTITAILALFFKKRTWVGIGVVTNVVINVVFWTINLAGAPVSNILLVASFPFQWIFFSTH